MSSTSTIASINESGIDSNRTKEGGRVIPRTLMIAVELGFPRTTELALMTAIDPMMRCAVATTTAMRRAVKPTRRLRLIGRLRRRLKRVSWSRSKRGPLRPRPIHLATSVASRNWLQARHGRTPLDEDDSTAVFGAANRVTLVAVPGGDGLGWPSVATRSRLRGG